MPLTKRSLALPANPAAVRLARAWVGQLLSEIDRDDLVLGAELGVSELVTNAILHAQPPLTVRVRGTRQHPRVEVSDHSPRPISLVQLPQDEEEMLDTFGRGLALVAINSAHWGWDHEADGTGKTVWFEPSAEMHDAVDLSAACQGPASPADTIPVPTPEDSVSIVLDNMPAQLFGTLRRYHYELRRELRLLSLSAPDQYPLAVEVTDVFDRLEAERLACSGIERLDAAIAQGREFVDLEYVVPPTTPATMAETLRLFAQVREEFAEEQLLAVSPEDELLALQLWYFGEFVRQGDGEPPIPWTPEHRARECSAS